MPEGTPSQGAGAEPKPGAGTDPGAKTPEPEPPRFKAIQSQEEFDRAIARRIAEERAKFQGYDEYRAAAARLKEIEDADRSDLEKARAEAAEWRAKAEGLEAAARLERQKAEAAAKWGVPAEALRGSTEEEVVLHAEQLAALLKPPAAGLVGSEGRGPAQAGASTAALFAQAVDGIL